MSKLFGLARNILYLIKVCKDLLRNNYTKNVNINKCNSLTSEYEINLNGLTCRYNQSINKSSTSSVAVATTTTVTTIGNTVRLTANLFHFSKQCLFYKV